MNRGLSLVGCEIASKDVVIQREEQVPRVLHGIELGHGPGQFMGEEVFGGGSFPS